MLYFNDFSADCREDFLAFRLHGRHRESAALSPTLRNTFRRMEIEPLLDPYLVEARQVGRIGQIQRFERAPEDARDDGVAVPFPLRRNDEHGAHSVLQRSRAIRYAVT